MSQLDGSGTLNFSNDLNSALALYSGASGSTGNFGALPTDLVSTVQPVGQTSGTTSTPPAPVTELSVDLVNEVVYGTTTGGSKVPLFDYTNMAGGSLNLGNSGTMTSAITIPPELLAQFEGIIGGTTPGPVSPTPIALPGLDTLLLQNPALFASLAGASQVPEPGSYALMGLGLLAIGLACRRAK